MKLKPENQNLQRKIIDQKIKPYLALKNTDTPKGGWLKAIRTSLGVSARQIAEALGIQSSNIIHLEKREQSGKVTIEYMEKVSDLLDCKFVYAIVPKAEFQSLEEILDERAKKASKEVFQRVKHAMKLEGQDQGVISKNESDYIKLLKDKLDSSLWSDLKNRIKLNN